MLGKDNRYFIVNQEKKRFFGNRAGLVLSLVVLLDRDGL